MDASNTIRYIPHLETAMVLFDLLLCLFLRMQKRSRTRINLRYLELVYVLTAGTIIDVITCYLLNHAAVVPLMILRPVRALNGIFAALICLELFRYMIAFLGIELSQAQRVAAALPLVFDLALWGMNPFNGLIYSYVGGGRSVRGPLFMTAHYYLPLLYLLACITITLFYHKRIERLQMIAFVLNLAFVIVLFLVQMLYVPYLMITYYVGSVAVFTMFFALETPAYDRLIETMDALEQARAYADASAAQALTASRSKSIFLTGMSEEIRSPITSIISLNDLILQDTHDRRIRRYALDLREAGKHLLGVVDDILVYSRIESGGEEIIEEPYDTRALLDAVSESSYLAATAKGLGLNVSAENTLPVSLTGDMAHILQVVNNLVSNAVKYTTEGTVRIQVAFRRRAREEGDLEITVADTGCGIREEDLPILFDSFTRVNLREHRSIAGTGLGLAITKRLTERMKGEVRVESVLHQGSTFTVLLPQKIADKTPLGAYDPSVLYQALDQRVQKRREEGGKVYRTLLEGKRILIIDDTSVNRTLIRNLLKGTGAEADTGRDGKSCLRMAAQTAYDLILLDHKMPVKDGVETFREMKELRETDPSFASRTCPVIAVTDEESREVQRYLIRQGFASSLLKPVDADMFYDTLRRVLQPKEEGQKKAKELTATP